jgi:hypothetical protein
VRLGAAFFRRLSNHKTTATTIGALKNARYEFFAFLTQAGMGMSIGWWRKPEAAGSNAIRLQRTEAPVADSEPIQPRSVAG